VKSQSAIVTRRFDGSPEDCARAILGFCWERDAGMEKEKKGVFTASRRGFERGHGHDQDAGQRSAAREQFVMSHPNRAGRRITLLHIGQISTCWADTMAGANWKSLTVPKGQIERISNAGRWRPARSPQRLRVIIQHWWLPTVTGCNSGGTMIKPV